MTFSVIITTYERPDYLRQSLQSAIKQSLKPNEIIIVNDASNANYDSVVEEFSEHITHYVKVAVSKGANHARNIGVEKANSKYVAFLDDDDEWFETFLELHSREYNLDANINAVVCGYQIMNGDSINVNKMQAVSERSLKVGNPFCGMSGVSAKREVAAFHPFDETLANGQDWDFFVRLVCAGNLIKNIASPLFYYRKNTPEGISAKTKSMKVEDADHRLASAFKHREWMGERNFKRRIAEQLLNYLPSKQNKFGWLLKSLKLAGLVTTARVVVTKLLRQK